MLATTSTTSKICFASLITSFPNSSKIFISSFVCYSNLSKQKMLGVKNKTLKKYGAVSKEVAEEMVNGIWNKYKINIACPEKGEKQRHIKLAEKNAEENIKLRNSNIENHNKFLLGLKNILKRFKAKRVNIPIEENSRISNHFDYKVVKKRLHQIIKILGGNTKISIESDLSLKNLDHLLSIKELKKLGILLDIGNIKADGFSIEDYINKFSKRIYGIHVKKKRNFF